MFFLKENVLVQTVQPPASSFFYTQAQQCPSSERKSPLLTTNTEMLALVSAICFPIVQALSKYCPSSLANYKLRAASPICLPQLNKQRECQLWMQDVVANTKIRRNHWGTINPNSCGSKMTSPKIQCTQVPRLTCFKMIHMDEDTSHTNVLHLNVNKDRFKHKQTHC